MVAELMSLDAKYILSYENLYEEKRHPRNKDIEYLKHKYGGEFIIFDYGNSVYWDKPKHTLSPEYINYLSVDQLLEKKDCELWEIVK
jgi:hypothetical protein